MHTFITFDNQLSRGVQAFGYCEMTHAMGGKGMATANFSPSPYTSNKKIKIKPFPLGLATNFTPVRTLYNTQREKIYYTRAMGAMRQTTALAPYPLVGRPSWQYDGCKKSFRKTLTGQPHPNYWQCVYDPRQGGFDPIVPPIASPFYMK